MWLTQINICNIYLNSLIYLANLGVRVARVRGPAEMGQTTQRRSQAEPTAERSIASCNGDGAAPVQVGVYLRGSQRGWETGVGARGRWQRQMACYVECLPACLFGNITNELRARSSSRRLSLHSQNAVSARQADKEDDDDVDDGVEVAATRKSCHLRHYKQLQISRE